MAETYKVRVEKDYLVFSAGHFITNDGDICERLHGHNYRVAAEVFGQLDENFYVVDFILLRDALQAIVAERLGVDEDKVTMDAEFIGDLIADSLDLVEVIMAMEQEFDVEIKDEDAENIRTVADAVQYIDEHGG